MMSRQSKRAASYGHWVDYGLFGSALTVICAVIALSLFK